MEIYVFISGNSNVIEIELEGSKNPILKIHISRDFRIYFSTFELFRIPRISIPGSRSENMYGI